MHLANVRRTEKVLVDAETHEKDLLKRMREKEQEEEMKELLSTPPLNDTDLENSIYERIGHELRYTHVTPKT